MSEPNPQPNCPLVKLPREVRDAIYLEVWRIVGLRQHIVAHWGTPDSEVDAKPHYCRWKCCTEFEVEDRLQELVENARIERGIAYGGWFTCTPDTGLEDYQGLLSSPWDNHWKCYTEIAKDHPRDYKDCALGPITGHSDKTPNTTTTQAAQQMETGCEKGQGNNQTTSTSTYPRADLDR
ncbi:hypothetical protein N0V84_009440 [Fusarium piperis]|uniref:Uncharacterized protein n=1 Tax=Fusarium piperis TaxID=1435070 RepID=A0A9W9BK86_9HYPO|nr:hypothetical protein N0V84_009440 [Fusarium piperis]